MLRLFVTALLLLNTAYFAWTQGWLGTPPTPYTTGREPMRLQQQIAPDRLVPLETSSETSEIRKGSKSP